MMEFKYPVGATPLDADELNDLIPTHITTQEELNAWESKNILTGQQWSLKQREILSDVFIKKLHEKMFDQTWKWAGKYRKSEKNLGISWQQIAQKINDLCADVQYQIDQNSYPKDEIAVRFHHRLVSIHPFPNGNGRLARLMADLLIMQLGQERFSWGMHQDLYSSNVFRKHYISALQSADQGDYSKLLLFCRS
jgi:Fic-DOC domain mobile mystery protein B